MNFLMLIPGLFTVLDRVLGPLFTSGAASSIVSGIVGGKTGGTLGGLLGLVEGAVGKIEDSQLAEIKAEMETLLAQQQLNTIDAVSPSFFRNGCRDTLEWGLSIIVLIHCGLVETFNILALLNGGTLQPLDTMTTFILMGLLGIYATTKTIERFQSNTTAN